MDLLLIFITFFTFTNARSATDQLIGEDDCTYCITQTCTPTITPATEFNAVKDKETIENAIKGWGTAKDVLISILTERSDYQRLKIAEEYIRTGRTLLDDIASDTSGKFLGALQALIKPLPLFYAGEIHDAVKTKNCAPVLEILATLPNCAIREISVVYRVMYGVSLAKDIASRAPSANIKKIILEMAKGDREEDEVNLDKAKKDAEALFAAGVNSWILNTNKFIDIFTKRSYPQLKATFDAYGIIRKEKDKKFESTVKDIGTLFKDRYLNCVFATIARNVENPHMYFAEELESALSGFVMNKDSQKVIRIIRGRSEIDLADINKKYENQYQDSLQNRIKEKTHSDFEKTLTAILKG